MPITKGSAQTLINEVLQELSEINKRKRQLEELLNNLENLIGGKTSGSSKEIIRTPIPIIGAREVRFRRKSSHAIKMVKILEKSGKAMRVPEIITAYPEHGWDASKTLATMLHRTISDRPDLFIRTGNGYVGLKERQQ